MSARGGELKDSLWKVWYDDSFHSERRIEAITNLARNHYIVKGSADSGLILANLLDVFSNQIDSDFGRERAISLRGTAYFYLENYPKALSQKLILLKIYQDRGAINDEANIHEWIGLIYYTQNNFEQALLYLNKARRLVPERASGFYSNLGSIYRDIGRPDSAISLYRKTLQIIKTVPDKYVEGSTYLNLGMTYLELDMTDSANSNFLKSLRVARENNFREMVAQGQAELGISLFKQGEIDQAKFHCTQALETAKNIQSEERACTCLYDIFKAEENPQKALLYNERLRELEAIKKDKDSQKELQQMEFQMEMLADSIAKAEEARLVVEAHEEEMRAEEKTRDFALGGGLILLILAGGLYGRVRYIRKSKAVLQTEKDRSESLLLNILPADIAAELKEKGRAEARDFDMVSILFTDFKGFTEASAKLSAQDLVSEINTCFEAFDGITAKYGVEKIKTIGDAYMAAGGVPVPTDDSVKNTVLAALEMQAFIAKRKAENDTTNKPAFEMRVGIHTGPVVAGIVGVKKFQYDIWGDTVNTASRMESSGEVGRVNISQATNELLKDDPDFVFESRGKIEAKGKGEIEMYFVSKA